MTNPSNKQLHIAGELLPCPFSGEIPTVKEYGGGHWSVHVNAKNFYPIQTHYALSRNDAIAIWNTRAALKGGES